MRKLIVFTGLGADESVFKNLEFKNFEVHHISWIEPLKDEDLEHYMLRMNIPKVEADTVVIGLSFGGVLAMKLAEKYEVKKVILISTILSKKDLPWYLKLVSVLHLQKVFPVQWFRKPSKLAYWMFGLKSADDKRVLDNIIGIMSAKYFRWASNQILNYKKIEKNINFVHIHGDNDKVLPIRNMKCKYVIKGGGHFALLNKWEQVQEMLNIELN